MFGQYLVGWPEKKFMLVKKISLSRVGTDYILATNRLKNSPYFTSILKIELMHCWGRTRRKILILFKIKNYFKLQTRKIEYEP